MIKAIKQYNVLCNNGIAKWLFFTFLFLIQLTSLAQSTDVLYCIKIAQSNKTILKPTTDSVEWQNKQQELQDNDWENGFLLAGTDSVTLKNDTITAWYYMGNKFYWLKIEADSSSQTLFNSFNINKLTTTPLAINKWNETKEKIILQYRNNGYPNARIALQNTVLHHDSLSATLQFVTGPFVRFGEIIVQGDTLLNNKFIARQIGYKKGQPYADEIVRNIDKRLNELNFIQLIQPSEIYRVDNLVNTYIFLRKKSASQFSGILGVANSTKTKNSLLLTGELNLNLINTLKKGEEFNLEWRKLQELTQELNTQIVYPFIAGSAIGIDASFSLYKRDTTYLTTNPNLGIRYQTKGSSYIRLFFELKTSNVLLQQQATELVGSISQQLYGIEYFDLNLDNQTNPYKGYKLKSSASTGKRTLKPKNTNTTSTENRQQYKIDAEAYIPIANKLTLKLRNQSAYLSGKSHVLNEMFRIGGINTLRGVEENSLRVSAFSVQTAEIRLIFESASAIFLFFDGAWIEQRQRANYYTDTPISLGAGMQFQTKAGLFSIQYAAGKQKGNPLSFSQAKIHIGYISRF